MVTVASKGRTVFHQALEIPEIIRMVFEELELESSKRTLTSAAQVCRFFKEPAMDMVWRHLDVGIVPLLSILPLKNKDGTLVCANA
jgi:hypothetical protein